MNQVMNTLLSHRSIRSYLDKPVSEEELNQIIKAVQSAPNWVNAQLVSIIAIKDKSRKKRLASLCGNQKYIEEAPVFLIFCADYHKIHLANQLENKTNEIVDVEDIDTLIVGAHEVGIALGTAVVSAESFGLGTVPIGDVRANAMDIIKELELPQYVVPLLGLCIGHPADSSATKPRLPKEAVYFEEKYNADLSNVLMEYNKTYSVYLSEREGNSRSGNWTKHVTDFYSNPFHYKGISEMLEKQKFPSGKK